MRIDTSFLKLTAASLALAALVACSGRESSAPVALEAGKHPANWVAQHWVVYNQQADRNLIFDSTSACAACHGSDGKGGISKVSCLSGQPQNGTSCHAGILGHPVGWGDPSAGSAFHRAAAQAAVPDLAKACGICHALEAGAVSVASAPSCLAKDAAWGISCHATSPAANPTGCLSCHGNSATGGPNQNAAPNRAHAHAKHLALAGVTCASCHFGAGTGTATHAKVTPLGGYTSASVLIQDNSQTTFKAKSFTSFGYAGERCSGVTCHGGKQTPNWKTGTLAVATSCDSCHELGAAQYNSYNSGSAPGFGNMHDFHVNGIHAACTDCHDLVKLGNQHFTALTSANDSNFAGPAENTIGSAKITNTGAGADYKATKACTATCHHPANAVRPWVQ